MDISKDKVLDAVNQLYAIGQDPTGGVTRLLYDENWFKAQQFLQKTFNQIGLENNFDEVGNLIGVLKGTKYPNETIASGSHIDTVRNGGKLDGQYGIIGAYLAIEHLYKTYGPPLRNLEVASFVEEEGSRFPFVYTGSKNYLGLIDAEMYKKLENAVDNNGIGMLDEMEKLGFSLKNGTKPARTDIKAFIELHIEQGNVLEMHKKCIGVVNAIAGQKRYTGKIIGQANHAGTTPMKFRKDAVYAFSKMCTHLIEKASTFDDTLVLTFGHVEIFPNIVNVVPGEVDFSIDCRHPDAEKLNQFVFEMEHYINTLQQELDITIEIKRWMDAAPVKMNEDLVYLIEQTAKKENILYEVVHSGAGHDSQMIAPYFPTAMIFVPSIKGISHSPDEDTKIEDLTQGVNFLAQVLYELAYKDELHIKGD